MKSAAGCSGKQMITQGISKKQHKAPNLYYNMKTA